MANGSTWGTPERHGRDATEPTRVALIAPHSIYRDGVETWLREQVWLELVGIATHEDGAGRLLTRAEPDVVILEDEAALQELAGVAPDASFVLMELPESLKDAERLVRLGAAGFICPDASRQSLELTLSAVARAHIVLPPGLASVLPVDAAAAEDDPRAQPDLDALTPREMDVLRLMGSTNRQIGTELGISVSTVKSHVHLILRKLGVSSRTAAMKVHLQAKSDG